MRTLFGTIFVAACACAAAAETITADVAVVGGGSAGFAAAWSAATLGSSVVLIEKEKVLGGTSTIGGVNNWEPVWGATGVPWRVYERLRRIPKAAGVAAHLSVTRGIPLREVPAADIRTTMEQRLDAR